MGQFASSSQYRQAGNKDLSSSCSVRDAMLAAVPSLRAFAKSMCRNSDQADDLVQEALVSGWSNIDSFESGTSMTAWLVTIFRQSFYSNYQKEGRSFQCLVGYAGSPARHAMRSRDLPSALQKLPPEQREAVLLVEALRYSYQEAAKICRCPVGTIRSRLSRGRSHLAECLSIGSPADSCEATMFERGGVGSCATNN
jgi:RNA polymerase sigma-70 factor (ECF subfamily)